jgi:hypothetical protein
MSLSGTLGVAYGGTGATSAGAALANLGAAPIENPFFTGTVAAPTVSTNTVQSPFGDLALETLGYGLIQMNSNVSVGDDYSTRDLDVHGDLIANVGTFRYGLATYVLRVGDTFSGGDTLLYGGNGYDPVLSLRMVGYGSNPFVGFYNPSGDLVASVSSTGTGGVAFGGLDQIMPSAASGPSLTIGGDVVPDGAGTRNLGSANFPYAQAYAYTPVRDLLLSVDVVPNDLNAMIVAYAPATLLVDNWISMPIGFRFTLANAISPTGNVQVNTPNSFFVSEANPGARDVCVIAAESTSLVFVKVALDLWVVQGNARSCD